MFGILMALFDVLNPKINNKGKALDAGIDAVTRGRGFTGNVVGHFARKFVNERYKK